MLTTHHRLQELRVTHGDALDTGCKEIAPDTGCYSGTVRAVA
jgi:hypothetical protein